MSDRRQLDLIGEAAAASDMLARAREQSDLTRALQAANLPSLVAAQTLTSMADSMALKTAREMAENVRRVELDQIATVPGALNAASELAAMGYTPSAAIAETSRTLNAMRILEAEHASTLRVSMQAFSDMAAVATTALEVQRTIESAKAGFAQTNAFEAAIAQMSLLTGAWAQERIVLPDMSAILALSEQVDALRTAEHYAAFGDFGRHDVLAKRMAAITEPWAVMTDLGVSAMAFGELAAFRDVIAYQPPFAPDTDAFVQDQLGKLVDARPRERPRTRERRRDEAGRNTALVAFPGQAYGQVVVAAGFELIVPMARPPITEDGTVAIFDSSHNGLITQLEQHVRQFVAQHLEALAGPRWLKQRVPGVLRTRWETKRDEARAAGRPVFALIQYADFIDLSEVISKQDNWNDVFGSVFVDRMGMQTAFRRLHPIRNALAHSRPLIKSEVLDLAAEGARLFRAMGLDVLPN